MAYRSFARSKADEGPELATRCGGRQLHCFGEQAHWASLGMQNRDTGRAHICLPELVLEEDKDALCEKGNPFPANPKPALPAMLTEEKHRQRFRNDATTQWGSRSPSPLHCTGALPAYSLAGLAEEPPWAGSRYHGA